MELLDKPEEKTQKELGQIALEKLKEKHREEQLAYRESQRKLQLMKERFLQEEQNVKDFTDCDIITLAKTLKSKGQISCKLLNAVMNALLDSQENITAFLKVDGALQALLRLLSGQNEKFQLLAAQCICNLALGDKEQSLRVLKASESYLMVHLSGKNQYVIEACLIALGNLSRQGKGNIILLLNQGFFSKIISLLSSDDQNLEAAAIYALLQLIYHGFDIVKEEDLQDVLAAVLPVFKKRSFSVAFLISILSSSCCTHFYLISNEVHSIALKQLLISLKQGQKEALYFLRIVSNLINEESGEVAKNLIENHIYNMRECISCLLQSKEEYLKKECLGLIGNFIRHPKEELRIYGTELIRENLKLIKLHMKHESLLV